MIICFEGVNGAGKTLQAGRLHQFLCEAVRKSGKDIGIYSFKDPGVGVMSPGGMKLRDLVLFGDWKGALTRTFLYLAGKSELNYELMKANPFKNFIILDRYLLSFYVYQLPEIRASLKEVGPFGTARSYGIIDTLVELLGCYIPDVTIYLKCDIDTLTERASRDTDTSDFYSPETREEVQYIVQRYDSVVRRFADEVFDPKKKYIGRQVITVSEEGDVSEHILQLLQPLLREYLGELLR